MTTPITIGFAGDVMIGRLVNGKIGLNGYKYPWGNTLPILKGTDINIVNLESTLTSSENAVDKVYNFKADPDRVQALIEGHVTIVSLANNHILDYNVEGMLETIEVLDKHNIKHTGAGINLCQACAPVIKDVNGIKIAVIGCTDNEPGWEAGETSPGTFYIRIGDIKKLKNIIRPIRPQVDIVIVSIHWGPNMRQHPSVEIQHFAHKIIDIGADIIHGHSAHIFQGIEVYKNKLIMYDNGDFIDDYVVDPYLSNDHSFFFRCLADKNGPIKLELIPVLIKHMQVNIAEGGDHDWCLERMRMLCNELNTLLFDYSIQIN